VVLAYLAVRASSASLALPPRPFAFQPGDEGFLQHVIWSPFFYLLDLVLFLPVDPVAAQPFWMSHPMWLALLAVVAVLLLSRSVRQAADGALVAFAAAWCALALLPAVTINVGERFLYLPSVGYCLIIGAASRPVLNALRLRDVVLAASVATLMGGVSVAKTIVFGALATRSRAAIDDALAAIDRAPEVTNVAVVDLAAASVLGFPHAVQLGRPSRPLTVQVLSVAPHFLGLAPDFSSRLQSGGRHTVVVQALGRPYLSSYLEQALLGEGVVRTGDSIDLSFVAIDVQDASDRALRTFRVRLTDAAIGRTVMLRGKGFRLEVLDPETPSARGDESAGAIRACRHAPRAASPPPACRPGRG
jgi:hypothetical protein